MILTHVVCVYFVFPVFIIRKCKPPLDLPSFIQRMLAKVDYGGLQKFVDIFL